MRAVPFVRQLCLASALALVAGAAVAACQRSASPAPILTPTAAPEVPATDAEQTLMRQRAEWGLRSDLAHVRAVATDPRATEYLAILMLPDEIAEMQARAANVDAVRGIVQAEANAAPNDFCGVYIDQQHAGAVTSMWKANLLVHEARIRSKVHPGARLAFRDCRFSESELHRLCELINADDRTWMDEIPALAIGWSCGSADNFVALDISSAAPDAAARILRYYTEAFGLPPGILVVRSDGNGAALKPWGSVLVTVLGVDGKPVGPNSLSLSWFSEVVGLQCGGGDVGYGVSWDEHPTELPCQEGTWTIQVVAIDEDTTIYGSTVVKVVGNMTTPLTFRLHQAPPAIGP